MKQRRVERRKGPDIMQKTFVVLSMIAWSMFLGSLIVYHYARPEIAYSGFSGGGPADYREHWDPELQSLFIYLLWCCCAITLSGIALNWRRSRRKSDHFKVNLGLLALIAVSSLLAYYWSLFS